MQKRANERILTILVAALIIIISFMNFSAWYYPLLNSDMAVGVLMSPGYSVPGDLYFWGQNHYGSLVSLLANILILTYLFPAALAFSFAHFAVLIAGYAAMSTLFRSKHIKIILAIAWFLPPWHFINQAISPAGIMMSTLAIGIFFLNRSLKPSSLLRSLVNLSLACISFILTIWVYDYSFVSLVLILLIAIWRLYPVYRRNNSIISGNRNFRFRTLVTIFWTLAGLAFILFAKHRALLAEIPAGFDLATSGSGMTIFLLDILTSIGRVLIFSSGNLVASIHTWLLAGLFLWIISYSRRNRKMRYFLRRNRWFLFFSCNAVIVLLAEMIIRRFSSSFIGDYFGSVVFISFWIAFLLYVEGTGSEKRWLRIVLLYAIIIPGAISSFVTFYLPYRIPPKIKSMAAFWQLGDAGIIAGYDDAYPAACANPKKIHTIPHDSDLIRNRNLITDVFRQPSLFVIGNGWLKTYPDTLRQFGQILLKDGKEFRLGGYEICRYDRYIYKQAYSLPQMRFQGSEEPDTNALSGKAAKTGAGFDRTKHFVYGPFIPLKKGKIYLEYRLKAGDNLNTSNAAVLDVSAQFGKKILASKTIRWCDFQKKNHYETFGMEVDIPGDYEGIEFRIMFLGGSDLWFDQVELTGM